VAVAAAVAVAGDWLWLCGLGRAVAGAGFLNGRNRSGIERVMSSIMFFFFFFFFFFLV
jgi:hypothetical protein